MAKNPKVKDPTEVALSAIQEALNISDTSPADGVRPDHGGRDAAPAVNPFDDRTPDLRPGGSDFDQQRMARPAANDDRETIGTILQLIQKGRPRRSAYTFAAVFSVLWIAAAGLLAFAFLPTLETVASQQGGVLALAGLACAFVAPLLLFYFLAGVAWRSQELSLIAQSMAQMAVRFSEPENVANGGIVTVGQAIRREVSAMGDGVERAIARAGELEALVTNEVSALERAYSDNEVRMRALLQDIATQRDNLVGQAEQVRNAISGVQIDLRQDIALLSDAIAARVDEMAQNITQTLESRGEHITSALGVAGDNMIIALGERGGDLLDRLEEASSQTARAVMDASEQLTASLNFKTGHVHEEFADLADRVHEILNDKIDRIATDFEMRSSTIVDGIAERADEIIGGVSEKTEKVYDSLKSSTDSLIVELDAHGGEVVNRIDEAGDRLADRILTSGDKASEALDVTVNTLVAKVVSQTETSHEALTSQIGSFEDLIRDRGAELAEKFARDSGTLGALITRHVAEFDRTVKTFGGEIVDRMGQHTQNIGDNLKNYIDTFEGRVSSHREQLHGVLDASLTGFQSAIESRVTNLDVSLDSKIKLFDETVDSKLQALEQSFDGRAASVTQTIESRSNELNETISTRFMQIHQGIEDRAGSIASDIEARVSRFENLLDIRVDAAASRVEASGQKASDVLLTRAEELTQSIKTRVDDSEQTLTTLISETSEAIQSSARIAQQSLLTLSGEVTSQLRSASTDIERAVETSAREAENVLSLSSSNATSQIKTASAEIERVLQTSTQAAEALLLQASGNASTQIKSISTEIEQALLTSAQTAETALTQASDTASTRIKSTSGEIERMIQISAAEVENVLVQASTTASTQLKSISGEIERALQVGAGAAEALLVQASNNASAQIKLSSEEIERALQTSANEAQSALIAAATNATAQIKTSSAEIERTMQVGAREAESTLILAATNASTQVKSSSDEIERTIASSTENLGAHVASKVAELTSGLQEQSDRIARALDERRTPLIEVITTKSDQLVQALGTKSEELAAVIGNATEVALTSIEGRGGAFTLAMMNNSADLARQINTASEIATGAVNKALKDIELTSRSAIDQSRQVATSAVTEMQETSKILRTDTVALFERLREGNILLQEVLTGAHENLNSLERALVTRVADFVSTLNDVTTRNGASANALEEQLAIFNRTTSGALEGLSSLSDKFETHGQMLAEAAKLVDESNDRASASVADRNTMLESLVTTIDIRTLDLDERLQRFTTLLDESLAAAENRARDIARVVAESAGASSSAVGRQFEAVRTAVEEERRQTLEAMSEIYEQGTQDAGSMFQQAADKFASIVHGMKQMASELHSELDSTRAELRRGVLEMPQEAAESTAQMRKVIVDQIEALAELNRIVARHGRGLDVAAPTRVTHREEEPVAATSGGRAETPRQTAPRRDATSASNLPPPDIGQRRTEAPPVSPVTPDQSRDGWLSDLLNRADGDTAPRGRAPQAQARPSANPLEALSLDISRLVDREMAAEMWDRYQRGERKAFSKRLYTPAGQKAFDEVARKYRADRTFKQTVDRYINEFERLLDEISRDERGPATLRNHLVSETGLVYTLLAHAAGRLG